MSSISDLLLLKFELGNEYYGLLLNTLSQVILLDNILTLPKCPECIYGVGSYKGTIITIVNTCYIFNKPLPEKIYIALLSEKYSHIGLVISEKITIKMISNININDMQISSVDESYGIILEGELLIDDILVQLISPKKVYDYLLENINAYLRKEFILYA